MQQPSSFLGVVLAQPISTASDPTFAITRKTRPSTKHHSVPAPNQHDAKTPHIIRSVSLPPPQILSPSETFEDACSNPRFTVNPSEVGFIPRDAWRDEDIPFGFLVMSFFRKRNSMHCKFPFKLYNALVLTDKHPLFFPYVGVRWVTETVLVVEKNVFAKLLGVRSVDGSLFHQQGNFPSHGFVELPFEEASQIARDNGIDTENTRFLRHATGDFRRNSQEVNLASIKWVRV